MKNFVFIIFFLLNLLNSNAQKLEGIWVSSHRVHFWKTDGVVQKDSSVAVSTVIIDFTGNNEFLLKEFGKEIQLCTIIKKGGNLQFRMEELVFNGRIENDQLTLELENENSLDKFVFVRMRPSQLKEEDLFDSASMSKSTWSIQAQKDSKNYCVKFHFLSERDGSDLSSLSTVEISKTCGEYGYTARGIYVIDSYKNYLFLGVRNPESDDEDIYHLYSRKDDVYEGYSYELEWFTDGDPVLNEFSLVKNAALESKDLSNLKSALLGEWETVDFRTRFDSRDSDYDQLEDEKLQIKLNQNGTFSLTHQGTLVNETMELAQKRIKNGTWSLSKNGTYIRMVYEKGIANEVITISELSEKELTLFYDIQNLNEDLEGRYGMSRMKIRMIRSTAPNNVYKQ